MRLVSVLVLVVVSIVLMPALVNAQTFNLSRLGLGSNVTPVAVQNDEHGINMAIVWKANDGGPIPSGFYLINPRRAGSLGAFCFEPVGVLNDWISNPNHVPSVSTVTVGSALMFQVVDLDGSDGNTPWWLFEPTFTWCK